MGEDKQGNYWCDYCGRKILSDPRFLIQSNDWTFDSVACKNEKYKLIQQHTDADEPKRKSIYSPRGEE